MDLIKIALEKIGVGNITVMNGIVVWRKGRDSFVSGWTVNIKSTGLRIDAAAEDIYHMAKNGR